MQICVGKNQIKFTEMKNLHKNHIKYKFPNDCSRGKTGLICLK